jgi:hypothetical protein
LNGFVPDPGDTFEILTGGDVTGEFNNASTYVFTDGTLGQFTMGYDDGRVTLFAFQQLPEPAATALAAMPMLVALCSRRRHSSRASSNDVMHQPRG